MTLLAATQEPNAGWGGLTALGLAVLAFWAFTSIYERYRKVKDQPLPPSGEGATLEGVKPQASAGSDPTVTPSQEVATTADADLDSFVRARVGKVRTNRLIVATQQRYRVSESTAKRALKRARQAGQP